MYGLLWMWIAACGQPQGPGPVDVDADADGDGFAASEDCDDANALVFPGAPDFCDDLSALENSCDHLAGNCLLDPCPAQRITFLGSDGRAEDWSDQTELEITRSGMVSLCGVTLASIRVAAPDVTVRGEDSFDNRLVNARGSAIVVEPDGARLVVEHLSVESAKDAPRGGGLRTEARAEVTLRDVTFHGCSSEGEGGAVYVQGDLTMEGGAVETNRAAGAGGGIWVAQGSVLIDGTTLDGNDAGSAGGGLFARDADVVLRNTGFDGNFAVTGGHVAVEGGTLVVERSSFDVAEYFATVGAALHLTGVDAEISGSAFFGNRVLMAGGGVYAVDSDLWVHDAWFDSNRADYFVDQGTQIEPGIGAGGALALVTTSARIEGTTFVDNQADRGSDLHLILGDESVELTDVTFQTAPREGTGHVEVVDAGTSAITGTLEAPLGAPGSWTCDRSGCR